MTVLSFGDVNSGELARAKAGWVRVTFPPIAKGAMDGARRRFGSVEESNGNCKRQYEDSDCARMTVLLVAVSFGGLGDFAAEEPVDDREVHEGEQHPEAPPDEADV